MLKAIVKPLIILIPMFLYVLTLPNIFKPFSPYSTYDYGYKRATGNYPNTCSSIFCKVHGKGFWEELFSKD